MQVGRPIIHVLSRHSSRIAYAPYSFRVRIRIKIGLGLGLLWLWIRDRD